MESMINFTGSQVRCGTAVLCGTESHSRMFQIGFAPEDIISKTTRGGEKQKISPHSRSVYRLHGASYIHLEMSTRVFDCLEETSVSVHFNVKACTILF